MRAFRCAALALWGVLGAQQALAACCVVDGPEDQVRCRSTGPPVDVALPRHQTLPPLAPGGKLVFSLDNYGCDAEVNRLTPKMALPAPSRPAIPKASPDPQG